MTGSLKIVIVEDDALIAMDLAELLVGMGHDVCSIASTEAEGVAAAFRCEPNLMIVDGSLAEGSGLSAMKQILQRGYVPHLYTTGDPEGILKAEPDAAVVAKPFNLHALANGIAQALSKADNPVIAPARTPA